jgi:SPP1 gp7 family putative phage head morphogenesis protein
VPRIGDRLAQGFASAIAEGRALSRGAGINQLRAELQGTGPAFAGLVSASPFDVARDQRRGKIFGDSYAARWVSKAQGATVAKAAGAANEATVGSVRRTAITESAESFNHGRAKALQAHARSSLLRVWDAYLDRRTCPSCSSADGTIVSIHEPFPQGEPGAVHPFCRCTWQPLTFDEVGQSGLILPSSEF